MTPAFCSPEQGQGQPVSRKTDIWSWGVSVLMMFTGAATWSAGYLAGGALEDYLERGPAEEGLPALPAALAELLKHCFRPDPEDRPRDMLEVLGVLQRLYPHATGRPYRREPPQATKALADSLNNRAVSLQDLHKAEEAERLWGEALAAGPEHPESTYNLGLTRWRAGRLSAEGLLHQLQEVCVSHPGEWLPQYLLAQAHLEQGNWGATVETLESVTGAGAALEEVGTALRAARERLANTGRLVRSIAAHAGWVFSVCSSRDGRYALSGSADGTLKFWEVHGGRCLRTFEGHTGWVTSVGLSADGGLALSGGADRTLRLWETATGRCLHTLEGHTNWVLAVALSADGRQALSAGGDGLFKRWDAAAGTCQGNLAGHGGPVLAVSWGADGCYALSGGRDKTLLLWEVAGGECLRHFTGHDDKVLAVALSPDGGRALSGGADRTVRLWDTATGTGLGTFEGHQGGVTSVCFSAGGSYALSGSEDRTVKLWHLVTGRCLATLEGHAGTVHSVCLAAGGCCVLSASADKTLALWRLPGDVSAPYVLSRVLPSDTALAAWADYERALARARQAVAAGEALAAARHVREARAQPGYGRRPEALNQWAGLYVRLPRKALQAGWEGHTCAAHAGAVTSVALSADGLHALSGSADGLVKLWETATGACLETFEEHLGGVTSVALSADGRYALSGSADATLKFWEVSGGRCLATCAGPADVVTSVSLSADGARALSGSTDGTVRLWETATGQLLRVLEGHTDTVHSVGLSADGRYALSGSAQFLVRNDGERLFTYGQLRLWETASGRCLPTFEGDADAVTAVSLSADGRHALSGGGHSVLQRSSGRFVQTGEVHLWELATGRLLRTFAGHAGPVTAVCLSGDGRYALSGSTDRTVKLWEVAGGQCLRTFAGHADAVTSVAFSGNGRYAASGSADRTLKLWVLDWELEDRPPEDWDEGARPYLEAFLALHTPYAGPPPRGRKRTVKELLHLPLTRLFASAPTEAEITQALTRRGSPCWGEEDFRGLLFTLGCAGYGWLRPEGVRRELEQMALDWEGPPPLSSD
jgi:WD40 repeat protein